MTGLELLNKMKRGKASNFHIFMNMVGNATSDEVMLSQNSFIDLINQGILILSKDFALAFAAKSIDVLDPYHVSMNDPKFVDFIDVYHNGVVLDQRNFKEEVIDNWYEPTGFGSFRLPSSFLGSVVYVKYACLLESISSLEDTIPLPDLFINALELFIIKELTGMSGNQEDDAVRAMGYKSWADTKEDLESMGYARTSFVTGTLTNNQKGWITW